MTKVDRSNLVKLDTYKNYFNKTITTTLFLENINTIKTRNNEKMSFLKLSDEYGSVEGVVFSNSLSKIGDIEKNNVYKINAKVEKRNNTYQLIVYKMILIK